MVGKKEPRLNHPFLNPMVAKPNAKGRDIRLVYANKKNSIYKKVGIEQDLMKSHDKGTQVLVTLGIVLLRGHVYLFFVGKGMQASQYLEQINTSKFNIGADDMGIQLIFHKSKGNAFLHIHIIINKPKNLLLECL